MLNAINLLTLSLMIFLIIDRLRTIFLLFGFCSINSIKALYSFRLYLTPFFVLENVFFLSIRLFNIENHCSSFIFISLKNISL